MDDPEVEKQLLHDIEVNFGGLKKKWEDVEDNDNLVGM